MKAKLDSSIACKKCNNLFNPSKMIIQHCINQLFKLNKEIETFITHKHIPCADIASYPIMTTYSSNCDLYRWDTMLF